MIKRIAAIVGILFLVAMYVVTLIMALTDKSQASSWFMTSLFCTAIVPIMIWMVIHFFEKINEDRKDHDSSSEQ